MLDQSLELRLRAALQAEGDRLALTITAADLERRLALRRRRVGGRLGSLGLAAAVALALGGLAAVAGGWFEPRPVVPLPSATVAPSSIASAAPSAGPSVVPSGPTAGMLTLDDLLARTDRSRVVRAQAVGPSGGPGDASDPGNDPIQPGAIEWDPVDVAGTYRLTTTCTGDGDLWIETGTGSASEMTTASCDGGIETRDHELAAGDRVRIRTTTSIAWRAVLEAPERAPLRADAIESAFDVPAGWTVLTELRSEDAEPSYRELTPSDPEERTFVDALPNRERYQIWISCAGPQPIQYAIGATVEQPDGEALSLRFVRAVVQCDGLTQVDAMDLPLRSGGELFVGFDPRVAWHMMVIAETPPIAQPAEDDAWRMSAASGPNFDPSGQEHVISVPGVEGGGDVRVTVACEGDGPLEVKVDIGARAGTTFDAWSVPCERGVATQVSEIYTDAPFQIEVTLDPGGAPMWQAVSVQVRR